MQLLSIFCNFWHICKEAKLHFWEVKKFRGLSEVIGSMNKTSQCWLSKYHSTKRKKSPIFQLYCLRSLQGSVKVHTFWDFEMSLPYYENVEKIVVFLKHILTEPTVIQECSTPEEYRELLTLMEERLRVMRQVANIFKRIANLIQSGNIET